MGNDQHTKDAYKTIAAGGGYLHRPDRGLIEVRGNDRAAWLNNLVTNTIKTLSPGEGNYAFAPNAKGRTVFDLNMLVLEDRLWLDIDRAWIGDALAHLNKYIITEDVALADASDAFDRIAVMGPGAKDVASRLGFGNLVPMAQLQNVERQIEGSAVRMIRNDYAGLPCAEFVYPADAESAKNGIVAACAEAGIGETFAEVVEIFRIEAGIPASRADIDAEVIPPETGRIEQGISHQKGCYLGQEVIERIRSQGMVAKKLVGLRTGGDAAMAPPARIRLDGNDVGRITSACWSEAMDASIALGYLKTAYADGDREFTVESGHDARPARRIACPVRRGKTVGAE